MSFGVLSNGSASASELYTKRVSVYIFYIFHFVIDIFTYSFKLVTLCMEKYLKECSKVRWLELVRTCLRFGRIALQKTDVGSLS